MEFRSKSFVFPAISAPARDAGVPLIWGAAPASFPAAPALRWGIMGCASIARKNVLAMTTAQSAVLVAVASRDAEKCEAWVAKNCPPARPAVKCYSSYEQLLADPDVDAVYIPLPTTLHFEWVLKAAACKKHVLVEKPCGTSLDEVRCAGSMVYVVIPHGVLVCWSQVDEMIGACADNGVQFMDGGSFQHMRETHARTARVRMNNSFNARQPAHGRHSNPMPRCSHVGRLPLRPIPLRRIPVPVLQ